MGRPLDDLSGKMFGYIDVLSFNRTTKDSETIRHDTYWNCFCNRCGKYFEMRARVLKNKNTTSCGCYRKEKSIKDFSGMKFGMLYVIRRLGESKNRKSVFLCECECGNILPIVGGNLTSGASKSCGCLSESLIARELKEYFSKNYNAVLEYNELVNEKTGRYLPYDIYLPEQNVYIEIQGEQHYRKDNYFTVKMSERNGTTINQEFKIRMYVDKLKKKHAKKNGVFIEIDLRKVKTTSEAICLIENMC